MNHHPALTPGRVAVVTGAASGIGLAAARRLGAAGMRLVLADIAQGPLDAAAAGLRESGAAVLAVPTDVGSREAVAALKAAASAFGEVSFLMNNAAREGGGGILAGAAVWEQTLATNLMGAVWGLQHFVPGMIEASWPCAVVNTGSKQGITLPPGDTAYNVSKAGLKALTESLAHDLRTAAAGGRVTAHLLIPGSTFTGFSRARGLHEKPEGAWTPEEVADFMLAAMARGDFYILCPDNEVTRAMDEKRIAWAAGDILLNRPALSRWHPDFAAAFKAHMEGGPSS